MLVVVKGRSMNVESSITPSFQEKEEGKRKAGKKVPLYAREDGLVVIDGLYSSLHRYFWSNAGTSTLKKPLFSEKAADVASSMDTEKRVRKAK